MGPRRRGGPSSASIRRGRCRFPQWSTSARSPGRPARRSCGAWRRREARFRFDLARGPLLRSTLVRTGDAGARVPLLDAGAPRRRRRLVSGHRLARGLRALYDQATGGAPAALPPLPVQYADYALWQRSWLPGRHPRAADEALWRERLAGLKPPALPLAHRPPAAAAPPHRRRTRAGRARDRRSRRRSRALAAARPGDAVHACYAAASLGGAAHARHTGGPLDLAVEHAIASATATASETEGLVGAWSPACARRRSPPTPTRTCRSRRLVEELPARSAACSGDVRSSRFILEPRQRVAPPRRPTRPDGG